MVDDDPGAVVPLVDGNTRPAALLGDRLEELDAGQILDDHHPDLAAELREAVGAPEAT